MKIYIRSASCISPQQTFHGQLFFNDAEEYTANLLKVIEPDYKKIFDAKLLRRMSRIVRVALAAATSCLKEAGKENVDAIVTGTAYGCMEDSETFLKKIVEQEEQMLSPTSFIQSTHNTVGAQIALFLKCHNYNNTFVHRGFSFEHAMIDAMLLLKENCAANVLAGSADEMTDFTFSVLKRFGLYKQLPVSNFELYGSDTKGSVCGQGTAFFLLSAEFADEAYAQIDTVETLYKYASSAEIKKWIERFFTQHKLTANDIDLVITGKNGDTRLDLLFTDLQKDIFKDNGVINYKHLCGEYPTSSSFALWLAANIIRRNKLPICFAGTQVKEKDFRKILIYNNYQGKYHSLVLVSSAVK
ncbi:MAG TPA: beta-ketoacyl synthase chain length factor [Parafilimonas sp.]|nr:beta-ketoacyl synthase chain length factor [Parafilimonas sp.]